MYLNPVIWQQALTFRGKFASEFLKYHGPTDASAGKTLVMLARKYGFSERTRDIPGKTLRDWLSSGNVPQWAVKAMVRYVIGNGFIPSDLCELQGVIAYLLIDIKGDISESDLLDMLKSLLHNVPEELVKQALTNVLS